jgi:hypothetical protein
MGTIVTRVRQVAILLLAGSSCFTATAHAANLAPVISGSPPGTAVAGKGYSFKPTASDPNGDALRYSVRGLPRWASFDRLTGRLHGYPGSRDVGTSDSITITVSDGRLAASLRAFKITVTRGAAPTIGGTPATSVVQGQSYSFQPVAYDVDSSTLTYSIANKPVWAAFSRATGALSGTPGAGTVGSYPGIVVSVSDGSNASRLPAFSIEVMASSTAQPEPEPAAGMATLSWVAPRLNTDSTPLTDLAGFRIRYGQDATLLDKVLEIASPTITSAVIEGLAAGTWHFAVKAYNAANVESDLSSIAEKTIQ